MIKVIEGHKVKRGANIQPIFLKFRANAMQYPGFISAENLASETDDFVNLFISTWNTVENWWSWEKSKIRIQLYLEAKELLVDEPRAKVYRIVPTYL